MFHFNPESGRVSTCQAKKGACPFGGSEFHSVKREDAQALYESSMKDKVIQVPIKLVPSSTESLGLMKRSSQMSPFENLAVAYDSLKEAGDLNAKRLSHLWDRETRSFTDPEQGELVHFIAHQQASIAFALGEAEHALKSNDPQTALTFLDRSVVNCTELGDAVMKHLRSLKDPVTGRYRDDEQTGFLHNLINAQAICLNKIWFVARAAKRQIDQ